MMTWAALLYGALAVIAIVGIALDEVRARITRPDASSPLSDLTLGDRITAALFGFVILGAFGSSIHYVLT